MRGCLVGVGLAGVIAALAPMSLGHAAQLPAAATYNEYQYVVSSTSSPPGLTSCHPVGTTLGGYQFYPGAAKTGAQSYGAIESGSVMHIQACSYPETPAPHLTSWSGTATCINTYTSGSPTTFALTFSWAITFDTTKTFLAVKTVTYPVTGGTCTEVRNTGFQRTGK